MLHYFAYGAMPHLIDDLLGRPVTMVPGHIVSHRLVIQTLEQVPEQIKHQGAQIPLRNLMRQLWGPDFSSFGIVRAPNRIVYGTVCEITEAERAIIAKWEFSPGWFSQMTTWARTPSLVRCTTEGFGPGQKYSPCQETYTHENPAPLLLPHGKAKKRAREVGEELRATT